MNSNFQKLTVRVSPEYFFWAAVLCAFSLILSPQKSLPQGKQTVATVAFAVKPEVVNPYKGLDLSAKAAYVYDVKTQKTLFARNALEPLPLASITKIMTAITALSLIPETTYIPISARAITEEGDSGLRVGERFLLRDLLKFMLIESSNDGAVAVSETVGAISAEGAYTSEENQALFIEKMNEVAQALGLSSTHFSSESGLDLDSETKAGAVSTASETARMFAYALEKFPSIFTETRWNELVLGSEEGEQHPAKNTNKDTRNLPLLIASKTGYTDLAGGNLVIAFDAGFNHPIIISVLGSTIDGRFTDVEKLVWSTLAYLTSH